jgi:tetratricopeptide (TPR) repeat protein
VPKKKTKKRRQPGPRSAAPDKHVGLRIVEYEITSDAIRDKRYEELPRHVRDAFEKLHGLLETDPGKAIDELLPWIEQYPDIPMLYNYLSVAYSCTGERGKARQTILENFQKNPDYLFARLNYAELLLMSGDYAKVAELLEHKFDLKLFYPERNRFHITEFVAFTSVVGRYFAGIGDRDTAKVAYDSLRKIAPDNAATRQLHDELHPGSLQNLMRLAMRSLYRPEQTKK